MPVPIAMRRKSSKRSSGKSPDWMTRKRAISEKLLTVMEPAEATRLHGELAKLAAELATLEEEWLALSAELES